MWRKTCSVCERLRFVEECLAGGACFAELCERFGVSRKTFYKWIERWRQAAGLGDDSPPEPLSPIPAEQGDSPLL